MGTKTRAFQLRYAIQALFSFHNNEVNTTIPFQIIGDVKA